MDNKIIVSLDRLSMAKALQLAEQAKGLVWGFKVNDLLLHYGAEIVYELKAFGKVMADPKLFDIPNTMRNSIRVLKAAGADLITVHASACYPPQEEELDHLAAVTVLTSFNQGIVGDVFGMVDVNATAYHFAALLEERNYKYMVCSPHEAAIAKTFGMQAICPGIRPQWYRDENDDHQRVTTPREAIKAGADLLIMGRPLTLAEDFVEALEKTLAEIN
jgi:orotidine-5'-phosphate decarboxylase